MKRFIPLLFCFTTGCWGIFGTGGTCPDHTVTLEDVYEGDNGATVEIDGDIVQLRDADGNVSRYRITDRQDWPTERQRCGPATEAQPFRVISLGQSSSSANVRILVEAIGGATFDPSLVTFDAGSSTVSTDGKVLALLLPGRLPNRNVVEASWTIDTPRGAVAESLTFDIRADEFGAFLTGAPCL